MEFNNAFDCPCLTPSGHKSELIQFFDWAFKSAVTSNYCIFISLCHTFKCLGDVINLFPPCPACELNLNAIDYFGYFCVIYPLLSLNLLPIITAFFMFNFSPSVVFFLPFTHSSLQKLKRLIPDEVGSFPHASLIFVLGSSQHPHDLTSFFIH